MKKLLKTTIIAIISALLLCLVQSQVYADEPTSNQTKRMATISDIYFTGQIWAVPDDCYATKSMSEHLSRLNKNLKPNIVVSVLDRDFVLQKSEIANMTDVATGTIDYNKLWSWCKYIADGFGSATTFRSWNGEILPIPKGDYKVKETFTTSDVITKVYPALLEFKDLHLDLQPALGDKYIDCDLTNQKIFWFENALCSFSSDCVTGKASTPTPTGIYSIKNLLGKTRLTGPTWDCWVDNWAAFYDGCGLHDASWQSSFGLARWQAGYGSHGCVNLPVGIASKMKNHMEVGEPIIVYKR